MAAATCADANTAATAAIIRGRQAPAWLTSLGLPARLVEPDGTVSPSRVAGRPGVTTPPRRQQPVERGGGRPGLVQRAERRAGHRVVVLGERLVAELLERRLPQRATRPRARRTGDSAQVSSQVKTGHTGPRQ